jgi:hypothetical protein
MKLLQNQFNFGIVSQSQYVTGNQVSLIIYQVNLFGVPLGSKKFQIRRRNKKNEILGITNGRISVLNAFLLVKVLMYRMIGIMIIRIMNILVMVFL